MLSESDIRKKLTQLRKSEGKMYAPLKYFRGLNTLKNVETRYKKMLKKDYTPFKTDKKVETRTSSYTSKFHKRYPGVTKLKDISKVTGIPLKMLKTVYDSGLDAWRTGLRPGTSPQSWAYARVQSFVVK